MGKSEFLEEVKHDDGSVKRTRKAASTTGTKKGSAKSDRAFPELVEDDSGPVSVGIVTLSSSRKGDNKDATKIGKHVPQLVESDQGPGAVQVVPERVPGDGPALIDDDDGPRAESSEMLSSKYMAIDSIR